MINADIFQRMAFVMDTEGQIHISSSRRLAEEAEREAVDVILAIGQNLIVCLYL